MSEESVQGFGDSPGSGSRLQNEGVEGEDSDSPAPVRFRIWGAAQHWEKGKGLCGSERS